MAFLYGPRPPSSITRTGTFEPFELQVSRDQITYHSAQSIFATFTTPATATQRTVWENGTTTAYAFPGSALTMQLVSTNAADTATITITGLDANYAPITEKLVLNGTTNVPTTLQYFRVNNISVFSGSSTNPAGVVTLSNSSTVYAQINAGVGSSQMAVYTVPAGYSFFIYSVLLSSSFNGNTTNYINYRVAVNQSNGVQRIILQQPFSTSYEVHRHIPFKYSEKTDIQWQVAPSATTAAVVGVNVQGILIKDDASVA